MNCAAHHAEQWVQLHNRLLLSNTEQFLTEPVPILVTGDTAGIYTRAKNNIRQPTIGAELRILIDRNAAGNPTFLTPQPTVHPWTLAKGWTLPGNNAIRYIGDSSELLTLGPTIIPGATYNITFSLRPVPGSGAIRGAVHFLTGVTAGTDRSTEATFTEAVVADAGGALQFEAVGVSAFEIFNVLIYPDTAPTDVIAALYTAPDALAALRSTESWTTITLPSATKTIVRHDRMLEYVNTASGFDLGLVLGGAYVAGKVYASVWARRYWWQQPASPV